MKSLLVNSSTDRRCLFRYSTLREKIEGSISDPPPKPTTLSSTHDTQVYFKDIEPYCSSVGKEQGDKGANCSTDNIIPYSLRSPLALPNPKSLLVLWRSPLRGDAIGSVADRAGSPSMWSPMRLTDAEPVTTTGATNIRDSSQRTTDRASLDEGGGEDVRRLEKARCEGEFAGPIPVGAFNDSRKTQS